MSFKKNSKGNSEEKKIMWKKTETGVMPFRHQTGNIQCHHRLGKARKDSSLGLSVRTLSA